MVHLLGWILGGNLKVGGRRTRKNSSSLCALAPFSATQIEVSILVSDSGFVSSNIYPTNCWCYLLSYCFWSTLPPPLVPPFHPPIQVNNYWHIWIHIESSNTCPSECWCYFLCLYSWSMLFSEIQMLSSAVIVFVADCFWLVLQYRIVCRSCGHYLIFFCLQYSTQYRTLRNGSMHPLLTKMKCLLQMKKSSWLFVGYIK